MGAIEPVGLLLIGAGRMGLTHMRALAHSRHVRIVAVADPTPDALAHARELDGDIVTQDDLAVALDQGQIDAVLIAAPSTLHRQLVGECAARKLPILCEKPCGVSTADIDAAARAAQEAGVLLQVGYWRRFVPELIRLREQVRQGRFGDLLLISSWQWDEQPPGAAFREASGGIVVDMAVHELDLIRWLTDQELQPDRTIASSGPAGAAAEDPDAAASLLRLSGGGLAMISLGRYFPHGDCVWVELMGTRDHARVEVLWGEPGEHVFLAALRAQAEEFARCVREGGPSAGATAGEARRTLELAEALSS